MKSAVETLSPTRVRLSIDIEFSELEPFIATAYKTFSERINVPGFRKGKVPNMMIDQRVGRGAVIEEAVNSSLNSFLSNAFRENKLAVIGRPVIDKLEFEDKKPLAFTAEVDIRPELKLPDFSKMTIEVVDVAVAEVHMERV